MTADRGPGRLSFVRDHGGLSDSGEFTPMAFGAVARRGGAWLPLIGISAVVGTLGALALPAVLGRTVDAFVAGENSTRWLALAIGLIAIGIATEMVDVVAETACVAGTTAWLRNRLVGHVLAIGPHGASRFATGDLVSRVSGNAADAAHAGPAVVSTIAAVLPPAGSLVLLAYIDFWVAAAFLAGVALVAVVLRTFARRTAELTADYQRAQGLIAARLTESLAGARTIAAAGTIVREQRRVLQPLPALREHGVRTWLTLARTSAEAGVIGPLVLVAVLIAGGLALVDGRITAGDLFAASRYAVIGAGLGSLTGVLARLARARASTHRAAEVMAVAPVGYGRQSLPNGPGTLELRGVTVRAGGTVLLDAINLTVPGRTSVAVVGRTGAGKSVLAAIVARLRDPDQGEVLLDGIPLRQLSHHALRAAVGCAFERPILVGTTIDDAIGPDPELVRVAARATRADDFISRLPQGYATPLVQAPMSGGETQRLGLARAWPAERLLVLDDATSSLDMMTEAQIGMALTDERPGRTRLVVTHRVATASRADLVVWLDAGRIRGIAPHSLLWTDPDYREVFQ